MQPSFQMNVLTDGTVRPAFYSSRSWHGARQGRMSEHIAFVFGEMSKQPVVETEYVDIRTLKIWTSDAGEALKDHRFPRSFPAPTVSCLFCRNTITVFPGC